jgi:hypothetical protein
MLQQIVLILPSHISPFQTVGSHDFSKILTICSQFCLPGKIIRSPQCEPAHGASTSDDAMRGNANGKAERRAYLDLR